MKLEILNLSGNLEVEASTMKLIVQFLIEKTDAIFSLQKLYLRRFLKTQQGLDEVLKEIKILFKQREKEFSPEDPSNKTQASGSVAGEKESNAVIPERTEKNLNKITPDLVLKDEG